jgi:hypothetical protein
METDKQTPELKQPEPPAPYVKPAVERIPLNEARASGTHFSQADLVLQHSS